MQAIARVDRVFRDKPGGLVVDYLGLANNLKSALRAYVLGGGKNGVPIEGVEDKVNELVAAIIEKLGVCRDFFHSFDYTPSLPMRSPNGTTESQSPMSQFVHPPNPERVRASSIASPIRQPRC